MGNDNEKKSLAIKVVGGIIVLATLVAAVRDGKKVVNDAKELFGEIKSRRRIKHIKAVK